MKDVARWVRHAERWTAWDTRMACAGRRSASGPCIGRRGCARCHADGPALQKGAQPEEGRRGADRGGGERNSIPESVPIACIETKEKDVIRERTHSRVLLAVGAALYLQGCGVTGAYHDSQRIESSSKPRSEACLTPEEENLLEEALRTRRGRAGRALVAIPDQPLRLVLEELLRRHMARRRPEPELRPRPRSTPAFRAPR